MLRETTRNEDEKLPGSRDEELQSRPSSACWKRKENVAWEEGGERFCYRGGGLLAINEQ